jgi:hypothetical protein
MKVITRHESPDTLILIEVPVLPGAAAYFPRNAIDYALEHSRIADKAYPQQSAQVFRTYDSYVDRGRKIPNLRYVGRHADLTPVLRVLIAGGYRGGLTVEYEGPFDRTLRLYESVRRARLAIDELRRDGAVIADEPASRDSRAV